MNQFGYNYSLEEINFCNFVLCMMDPYQLTEDIPFALGVFLCFETKRNIQILHENVHATLD